MDKSDLTVKHESADYELLARNWWQLLPRAAADNVKTAAATATATAAAAATTVSRWNASWTI
jgi:hypothetical protein